VPSKGYGSYRGFCLVFLIFYIFFLVVWWYLGYRQRIGGAGEVNGGKVQFIMLVVQQSVAAGQ